MKNLYLVSYDITNPKRLSKTFKALKGFGDHTQYSVFLCSLNPKEKVLLNEALLNAINQKEDRILIVNIGPSEGTATSRIEVIGIQEPPVEPGPVIV